MPGTFDRLSARRVLPFALTAAVGLLSALIPPSPDPRWLAIAAAIAGVIVLAPIVYPWARPPQPLSVLPPFLFLLVVAILRDASGGSGSGFAPLVLLSVFWVALYGVRWQLAAVLLGVGALFSLPLAGVLGGEYGNGQARYAIIWVAASALIGFTAQALVSRQRAQQSALAEQRDFLDTMFDSAGSLVAVLEPDGRVVRINPACERTGGFSQEEIVGRYFWDVLLPSEAIAAMAERWTGGERDPLDGVAETPMVDRDGEHHLIHWTVTSLRDDRGRVANFVATGLDVTERKRFERELRHLAEHDPLTGLLNRRRFEAELARHLAHIARYGEAGALLLFDIDGFKTVNDSLGHAKGDEAIVATAKAIGTELRRTDRFARLGGDEFAVLLPEADRAQAEVAAGRLLEMARGVRLPLPDGAERRITISVGVVTFSTEEHLTPDQPLIAADLAMYEAKREGGDRYRLLERHRVGGCAAPPAHPPRPGQPASAAARAAATSSWNRASAAPREVEAPPCALRAQIA